MRTYDKKKWQELADRYFDAQTTDEEEQLLKRFLVSGKAAGKEFEEIRAVMGFLQKGKTVHSKDSSRFRFSWRWISVAASAILVLSVGLGIMDSRRNVCVAYIGGQKCTDTEKVMRQMSISMKQVNIEEESADVEGQLKDMFQTINDVEQDRK